MAKSIDDGPDIPRLTCLTDEDMVVPRLDNSLGTPVAGEKTDEIIPVILRLHEEAGTREETRRRRHIPIAPVKGIKLVLVAVNLNDDGICEELASEFGIEDNLSFRSGEAGREDDLVEDVAKDGIEFGGRGFREDDRRLYLRKNMLEKQGHKDKDAGGIQGFSLLD